MNDALGKMWGWPALAATECARRAKIAGDWRRAARNYRIALAFDPANPATLVQYGNALRECGALADAEDAYRRSLRLDPGVPDAQLQLGHALKLQRRFDDAIAAYRRAIELDPLLYDASLELLALGYARHVARPAAPVAETTAKPAASPLRPLIVFDATDLLDHLAHSRSATGIQRVQIGVIASLLREPVSEFEIAVAYFRERPDEFVAVPEDFFLHLADLVQWSTGPPDPAWRQAVQQLIALRVFGARLQFRDGTALVNLGTSWTLANYFLTLRTIRSRYRINYLPFVHDCIPALFPELCATETVRDYLGWIAGVFRHADGFLVNSSTTARDLTRVGAALGHSVAPPRRIALDAGFQRGGGVKPPGGKHAVPIGRRPDREPFVLFVASFELRKNHRAAFGAWRELIERRGRRNVPLLVCVGGHGWQEDATMQLLRSSRALRNRVRISPWVSDAVLDRLYRDCLFTLYPSLYEGWGLPVTESLSYGKVPLVAAIPALRESGGDLAEYFDPARDGDLVAKLQRLIDDRPYLARREAEIRHGFRGRRWREVAQDILDSVRPLLASGTGDDRRARSAGTSRAMPIEIGRYYPMARNTGMRLGPELDSGEACRMGAGWWAPEEWGCWLKAGRAELEFAVSDDAGEAWLQLDVEGNPDRVVEVAVSISGKAPTVTARVAPRERRQIAVRLDWASVSDHLASISIDTSGSCALGDTSGSGALGDTSGSGALGETSGDWDQRVVSVGLRGFALAPGGIAAAAAEIGHPATIPV